MKRAYTIERNELIVDLYKKGKTIKEISADMKLGKEYIRRILVEAGVIEEKKHIRISAEAKARILEMLQASVPHATISSELNVSTAVVGYYAHAYDLHRSSRITSEQIHQMDYLRYQCGLSNKAISMRMGITTTTVSKHIGHEPKEPTQINHRAAMEILKIRRNAERKSKIAMQKLALEEQRKAAEAARLEAERIERERLEAERIERERIEALRLAKENEIKELLASLGIPCENFTIESAETGDAFLNNLITRAAEKLSVGA